MLAMRPEVLVLDEATAMLDPRGRQDVLNIVERLHHERGMTVVMITQHMEEAARCDRIAVLDDGRLVMTGSPREVFGRVEELRAAGLERHSREPLRQLLSARPGALAQLARAIADFPVSVTGTRGFDAAQVTAGGAATGSFDPRTLQSRLCPGLYAAGEVLDVDGACGGFNLMFAVASGLVAGGAK